MRKLLYSAAAAAALAIASTANAAVIVTVPAPPVYTPPTSGGLIGQVTAGATNNDVFTFNIVGAPALFSGQLSNTSLGPNGAGNLNFTNIVLDGVAGLFSLVTLPGAAETWACCQPNGNGSVLLGTGEHRLTYTVANTSNVLGTYSGNFNFALNPAPVPEPATWAMMLLGFAGIGFAMRRGRKPVLAQIA